MSLVTPESTATPTSLVAIEPEYPSSTNSGAIYQECVVSFKMRKQIKNGVTQTFYSSMEY